MGKRFYLEKLLERARGRTGTEGAAPVVLPPGVAGLLSYAPTPPHRRRDKPRGCDPMCTSLFRVVAILHDDARDLDGCAICRHCGTVWCPR